MAIIYEIKSVGDEYTVTFTIKSHADKVEFHDRVAIRSSEPGQFIADVFNMFREKEYADRCGLMKTKPTANIFPLDTSPHFRQHRTNKRRTQ